MIIDEIEERIKTETPELHQMFLELIKCVTHLRIQNVADYYEFGANRDPWTWDGTKDFPGCRPPFQSFLAEWRFPKLRRGKTEGQLAKPRIFAGEGFAVLGHVVDSGEVGECEATMYYLTTFPFVQPLFSYSSEKFLKNGDWKCDSNEAYVNISNPKSLKIDKDLHQRANAVQDLMLSSLHTALLSFSFANCKNTNIVETRFNPGLTRKRLDADRIPVDKFYTLEIEPMKKAIKAAQESHGVGVQQALHICRGHFKDFRSSPGLFGQHRNVYWWDQQVRGDEALGKIKKDYEIKGPQE